MKKISILTAVVLATLVFTPAYRAQALILNLNAQAGINQTFANDTNVTISSASNVHTLGWSGLLAPARGGTGADISGFSAGSLLFYDGSGIAQNINMLHWDDAGSLLTIGGNLSTSGNVNIDGTLAFGAIQGNVNFTPSGAQWLVQDQTSGNLDGGNLYFSAGSPHGDANGGGITLEARDVGATNSGNGGSFTVYTGGAGSEGNGGDVIMHIGRGASSGRNGRIVLDGNGATPIINIGNVDGPAFTFPETSGTFSVLEADQTFTGVNTFSNPVNNFISDSDSTIYVGNDGIPGCIAMGDSDNSGVTYVTANDGVLTSSSTQPGNCQ